MSDFLSNFSNGKYKKEDTRHPVEKKSSSQESDMAKEEVVKQGVSASKSTPKSSDSNTDNNEKLVDQIQEPSASQPVIKNSLLVKDQLFAKKRQMKRFIIGGASCLIVASICLFYYKQTHVTLPDFTNKPVSKAQSWADDNQVKLEIDRVYQLDKKVNTIIKQADKNKSIAKKKGTKLTVSLGADPKVKIKLPDFSKL